MNSHRPLPTTLLYKDCNKKKETTLFMTKTAVASPSVCHALELAWPRTHSRAEVISPPEQIKIVGDNLRWSETRRPGEKDWRRTRAAAAAAGAARTLHQSCLCAFVTSHQMTGSSRQVCLPKYFQLAHTHTHTHTHTQ